MKKIRERGRNRLEEWRKGRGTEGDYSSTRFGLGNLGTRAVVCQIRWVRSGACNVLRVVPRRQFSKDN